LSTTPLDLKAQALKLKQAAKDEIGQRVALSRMYYACFHACNSWHNNLPGHMLGNLTCSNKAGSHEQLISRLSNPSKKSSKARSVASMDLAKALRVLRDYRTTSDYHIKDNIDEEWLMDADDHLFQIFKSISQDVGEAQ
jgi:uncharacterized protein (UPF0332 family)